jgi:hypothetical protein
MGLRGELFSTRVLLQNRTYFFNIKENRLGDLYLNIVESKNRDEGGFDRQSVILFADDLQEFLKGFDESLRVLEKEIRQRRHSKAPFENPQYAHHAPAKEGPPSRERAPSKEGDDRGRARSGIRGRKGDAKGERYGKNPNSADRHHGERPRKGPHPKEGKRVVVRKRKDFD